MGNAASDFSKENLQKLAIEAFISATDIETIILHMKEPLEQEKLIFDQKYRGHQEECKEDSKTRFRSIQQNAFDKCHNFIHKLLTDSIGATSKPQNAGDQSEGVNTQDWLV